MRPVARGTEVLLTRIETDREHRLTNTGPDVVGLVLALGHEGLLGGGERREDEDAAHRSLTSCPHAGSRDAVKNRRDRRVAAVACGPQRSRWAAPAQAAMRRMRRRRGAVDSREADRCVLRGCSPWPRKDCFAPRSLLKLAFASVLQTARVGIPSITTQVTRAVSTGGGIGIGIG